MMKQGKTAAEPNAKRRITIERTFQAPIEDIWDLWTTKEGIESWVGRAAIMTRFAMSPVRSVLAPMQSPGVGVARRTGDLRQNSRSSE
jgi:hypothetical protein